MSKKKISFKDLPNDCICRIGTPGGDEVEIMDNKFQHYNSECPYYEKDNTTFLDDVEPRKEVKPEDKQLVTLKGNLPVGTSQRQLNEMFKEDLKRTAEGVVPRLPQIEILHAGALLFKIPSDEIGGTETV